MRPVGGMVERVGLDSEDYHNVHSYFALQRHGALIRDALSWEEYWRWDNDDMIAAVYYSREHKPLGLRSLLHCQRGFPYQGNGLSEY